MGYPTPRPTALRERGRFIGLSIAHVLADFYGIFPAPLLRSFGSHLNVGYGSVSLLLGVNSVASGLAGVVVGLASDRWKGAGRLLILTAAGVTVLAMSAIGLVANYWLLMLLMATGAFACGAFHPPGFAAAGEMTRPHRQRGVSIIMAVGVAGGSVGPLFVSQVVANRGGVWATSLCVVPGLALLGIAALLLRGQGNPGAPAPSQPDPPVARDAAPDRPRMVVALLFGNTVLRVFAHMSVLVLISQLMETSWGFSVVDSGLGVGALQLGAGLGGLLVASLAATGQERRAILTCVPLTAVILVPMAFTTGRLWWLWLFLYGIGVNGPGPLVVSLAQRVATHRSALVSGLMITVAFAVGGQFAAVTSPWLLKTYGQVHALTFLTVPLILSWLAAVLLPKEGP